MPDQPPGPNPWGMPNQPPGIKQYPVIPMSSQQKQTIKNIINSETAPYKIKATFINDNQTPTDIVVGMTSLKELGIYGVTGLPENLLPEVVAGLPPGNQNPYVTMTIDSSLPDNVSAFNLSTFTIMHEFGLS